MLAGALSVLRPAGCALVGGHSSEGAELALGECTQWGLLGSAGHLRSLRPAASSQLCPRRLLLPHQHGYRPRLPGRVASTAPPAAAAGFSVYGSVPREELLSKAGMLPGQALILTKPLGTGELACGTADVLTSPPPPPLRPYNRLQQCNCALSAKLFKGAAWPCVPQ